VTTTATDLCVFLVVWLGLSWLVDWWVLAGAGERWDRGMLIGDKRQSAAPGWIVLVLWGGGR
jgi:hypothetical protein